MPVPTAAGGLAPVTLWPALALGVLALLAAGLAAWAVRAHRAALASRLRGWAAAYPLAVPLAVVAGVALAGVGAFAGIAGSWQHGGALEALDVRVNGALGSLSPGAVAFLRAVTHLADAPTLWVASLGLVALLWAGRYRWQAAALALASGGGNLWMVLLKQGFGRVRPENVYGATTPSFPSGHATGSVLLYGFLAWFVATRPWHPAVRVPLALSLALLPVVIGLSRIGLSVHWASDVLGGWVLGLAWLVVTLVGVGAARAYFRASSSLHAR